MDNATDVISPAYSVSSNAATRRIIPDLPLTPALPIPFDDAVEPELATDLD